MNSRLETFCDGVFAIAITLLILDIRVPPVESVHSFAEVWRDVAQLWPSFLALSLSFTIIFISWIGHHNILRIIDKSSPFFLFANGFFLFTVIIIPFPTAFMAEYLNTPYAQPAIVLYSLNNTLHNVGWNILHRSIVKPRPLFKAGVDSELVKGAARGAQIGFLVNVGIILIAWFFPYVALAISVFVWAYWLYLSVSVKPSKAAS